MFRWGEKSWSHHRCSFACPVTESQSLFCGYLLLISPCGIRDPFKNQTDYFIALATAPKAFGQPWHNWYLSGKSRRKNAAIKEGLLCNGKSLNLLEFLKVENQTFIRFGNESPWIYGCSKLNWPWKLRPLEEKEQTVNFQTISVLGSSCDSSQKNRENAILNWKVQTKS